MADEYEMEGDDTLQSTDTGGPQAEQVAQTGEAPAQQPEAEEKHVQRLLQTIRADKRHFEPAMKAMRDSMFMAMKGRSRDWSEKNYKANIAGNHVKTKTSSLYAKNPKIVARRKDSMDFAVWDENPESLMIALQIVQQGTVAMAAAQAAMQAPMGGDPMMGAAPAVPGMGGNGGPPLDPLAPAPAPVMPPGYDEALAVVEDFQNGMKRRQMLKKFGRTLELVFANSMRAQTPLDFKTGMKKVVRRACTTAVGYVELGFQKIYGVPDATTEKLADYRTRIAHLEKLRAGLAEGEFHETDAEYDELTKGLAALEAEDQIVLRSGLTFDFLQSTKVIPDKLCTSLVGFVGARHLTLEYLYKKCEVRELFGVDLGDNYTPYTVDGDRDDSSAPRGVDMGDDGHTGVFGPAGKDDDLVCVYKHYDKPSGLVYHLCEGYKGFLKPPAAPDVKLPRFWPDYALTFNDVESEETPFPPSDVELLKDQQDEVNRSRQGKREHRRFARPRFFFSNGSVDEKDIPNLMKDEPFTVTALNKDPSVKIADLIEAFDAPGVDPNLYDTNEVLQDLTMTVGAQAAQMGGTAKATATEAAIADGTTNSVDASSVDDLDSFLTMMARDGGLILMQNMTKEEVVRVVGPGAVWVEDLGMTPEDIYEEIYLEVEAGSTGKPNQAAEIRVIKEIGPILLQIPGIQPTWLAREMLRRFDDRLDLTEAVSEGLPAIVAQNRNAQPAAGDPASDPNQQGEKGGDKGPPAPGGPTGSGPAMGSNQTP